MVLKCRFNDLLSNVLVLSPILRRAEPRRIKGVTNHQVQVGSSYHHAAIDFVDLELTLLKQINIQQTFSGIKHVIFSLTVGIMRSDSAGRDCN